MEDAKKALTAKEGIELDLKEHKEFKLFLNNDIFKLKIAKTNGKKEIIFQISKANQMIAIIYERMFSFNEIVNIDKTFRIYEEFEEIYSVLITF